MCTLVAYDANLQIMPQCFGLFRTETESNWHHFMFLVFTEFPHFRTILSDGTKGLDCLADIFAAHRKIHALCAWHILEKNLKKANPPFKYTKYVFPSSMWSSCRIRYSLFQPLHYQPPATVVYMSNFAPHFYQHTRCICDVNNGYSPFCDNYFSGLIVLYAVQNWLSATVD